MPHLSDEERRKLVEAYQRKARANLLEAKAAMGPEPEMRVHSVITRAYYAVYQAANAWMALHGGYPDVPNPKKDNWSHEAVNEHWREILTDLHDDCCVDFPFGADNYYTILKSLRVSVDYGRRHEPSWRDASRAIDAAEQALQGLLQGIKRWEERTS